MLKKKNRAEGGEVPSSQPAASVDEESVAKQQGLPQFFQKPAALEKNRHAKSGLLTQTNFGFARAANSVALAAIEFIEAAKHYPIVFTLGDKPAALAILGMEQQNYLVDADGKWLEGAYIPAYVRQYPFVFFEQPSDNKFFLCVDEKSPHFRAEGGEGTTALFNADGTASAMTNQALEFCSSYYQHHAITRHLIADLEAHKLLAPYQSQVTLNSGRVVTLSGFSMIDETAFNALPEKTFLEFRTKGWLPFIYLALASTSNWKRLASLSGR